MKCVLTIVVDNTAQDPACLPEYGFSAWMETEKHRVLFDTGAGGEALPHNAGVLGIPLERADTLILSHGHYDHTSGIHHVLGHGRLERIFLHPETTRPRFKRLDAPPHKSIGMLPEVAAALSGRPEAVYSEQPMQVAEGMWITGPIPRLTPFEDVGGPFFVDSECVVADDLVDDQALWLETKEGIVVLLGCAHSGVVNTLNYIAELTAANEFLAVFGGTHLMEASPLRMVRTAEALHSFNVKMLAPCHCTGENATAFLRERFSAQFVAVGAGARFEFPM